MIEPMPYLTAFSLALVGSLILTPVAERLAVRMGAMDAPDPRKVHHVPTPRWGGLAVAAGVLLSVVLTLLLYRQAQAYLDFRTQRYLTGILAGGCLMLLLGMLDDRFNLPAKVKLMGQILIAVILIKSGVVITFLTIPGMGFVYLPAWLSWGLSLLWIVGITNAINLLDGLDGLLSGVSTIVAFLFFVVALLKGQFVVALVMASLAGACGGFLRYNYNPARIFLGDSGSLLLGMLFASLSIVGALKVTTTAAIFVPVLFLGLPIFDTSFAILRRFLAGRPIFSPDKEHVHHQLLARGMSVKQAVMLIYAICFTLGAIGISLAFIIP
jgi:UDP-GlcNAc:undecaprenyl-phosphate GlcNAc-1-phosphate transferase